MGTKERLIALQYRVNKLQSLIKRMETFYDSESKELQILKQRYNQERLSDLMKNGLKNYETEGWWMNRY